VEVAEIVCPRCGHRNPLGSNFCSSCGFALNQHPEDTATITFAQEVPLDAPAPVVVEEPVVDLEHPGLLVVTRGPNVGARVPLSDSVTTVGRHPDSDLFLDDITVSRRHAEITYSAGRYQIRDVGSLNGTYVNRQRVDEVWLEPGDEVQIGKFKLVFMSRAAEEGSS
jgi:pSer/pThr/pTyr-binding forkhead associated (FHA) protein